VFYFERYLKTLETSDQGKLPDRFSGSIVRPALIAYFHLARLYDRFIVVGDAILKNKVGRMDR
jgi:hypothetical protein